MSDPFQYKSPLLFRNAHLQSIYPTLFRKVDGISYYRRRIATPDNDFLDLDWSFAADWNPEQTQPESNRLVIISHGLEGSTDRQYVKGTVRTFNLAGWDAVAWNFRGCSGEPNNKPEFYHSGASHDLRTVIKFVLRKTDYESIALVGYSMGGNITLKYLGEEGGDISERIHCATAISVPCDLTTAAAELARPRCKIYMNYFLKKLHRKIKAKQQHYPKLLSDDGFSNISTFREFDERYTAPLHGFESAEDYWQKASCKPWIPKIEIPSLLINAEDDPFLSSECYPHEFAEQKNKFSLLTPKHGGHCGFIQLKNIAYWSESVALQWSEKKLKKN